MRSTILRTAIAFAIALAASPSFAAVFYGSRVTDTQIVAYDGWQGSAGGLLVTWSIDYDGSEALPWIYTYTITNADGSTLNPDLSHVIFESSANFTQDDISIDLDLEGNDGPKTWGADPNSPNSDNPGTNNANPNLPADLFGFKIDAKYFDDGSITFNSSRAPMWGDIYMKDGKHDGIVATAWNTGIGTNASPLNLPLDNWDDINEGNDNNWSDFGDWIAVPDTTDFPPPPPPPGDAPEPTTVVIWSLLGLVGVVHQVRRRRAS